MRRTLAPFFAVAFLVIGTAFLNDGTSKSDLSQTATIISGAAFLSFGLISTWFAVKNRLKWGRVYKEYRGE
jgi:drug/metabolite transporter superfamily protein YnfA